MALGFAVKVHNILADLCLRERVVFSGSFERFWYSLCALEIRQLCRHWDAALGAGCPVCTMDEKGLTSCGV